MQIAETIQTLSPYQELVAYEYLWTERGSSFKKMAELLSFKKVLPSQVATSKYESLFGEVPSEIGLIKKLIDSKKGRFSIILKENTQYPAQLLDAKYPINLFYYRGSLDIAKQRNVSVVGTRKISEDGIRRTKKLVSLLSNHGYGIVSGLALGTDTVALQTAIDTGAKVIGVVGTPIDEYYPRENKALQDKIGLDHLLISQVPFYKYSVEPFNTKRVYFVERDATMAAISMATVIVEAGETSGTLIQARACLEQGRPVFILNSCFENPNITWPQKYLERGAIRVRNLDDILTELKNKYPVNNGGSNDVESL